MNINDKIEELVNYGSTLNREEIYERFRNYNKQEGQNINELFEIMMDVVACFDIKETDPLYLAMEMLIENLTETEKELMLQKTSDKFGVNFEALGLWL